MSDIQRIFTNKPIKNGGIVVAANGLGFDKDHVGTLVREVIDPPTFANYTGSWVCPDNVTKILVECWGQGGRGGTAATLANVGAGGGGGAAYAASILDVIPSSSYSFVVANTSGTASNTWFSGQTVLFAARGSTAGNPTAGAGGLASACFGQVIIPGDNGGSGTNEVPGDANQVSQYVGTECFGAAGGNAGNHANGGGDGAPINTVVGVGSRGTAPGGGGSGGKRAGSGSNAGGIGGAGRIIISYYVQTPTLSVGIGTIQDKYTERFDDPTYYE